LRDPKDYEAPLCAQIGGDWWFPEKEDHPAGRIDAVHAKSICRRCPHQAECAEWGIENESFGIWGGLSQKQRRVFRRRRRIITRQEGKSA